MKNKLSNPKWSLYMAFMLILLLITTNSCAQEILKLEEGQSPGKGKLDQLDWLTGYWKGAGLGGTCDEIWMPAIDNSMAGIFRYAKDGKVQFTEYLHIEEQGESLSVKLKHFNRDLSPWEEKDKWAEFKLVKIEGQTAYFDGLTYHRDEDVLIFRASIKSNDKSRVEEIRFERIKI